MSIHENHKNKKAKWNFILFFGSIVFCFSILPNFSKADSLPLQCLGIYSKRFLPLTLNTPDIADKIAEIQQMNVHIMYAPTAGYRFSPDIEHSEHERIEFGDPSTVSITDHSTLHSLEHTRSLLADHESGFINSFESEFNAMEHLLQYQQTSPEIISRMHQVFQLAKTTILKQRAYAAELKILEQEEKTALSSNNRNSRAIEFIRGDKLRLFLDFRHYFSEPLRRALIEIAPHGILLTNNQIRGHINNSIHTSIPIYQMLTSSILDSLNFDTDVKLKDFIPERRRH